MVTGGDCGIRLRHALASADALWRMCVVNRIPAFKVAKSLGLREGQTRGVIALLKSYGSCPSPERLALVAMKDPGLDDADIAEMFGRSVRWASVVRSKADQIRAEEYIRPEREYLDDGLQPGDPMPDELWRRAAEVREQRSGRRTDLAPQDLTGPRAYQWRGNAFVSIGS